MQIIPEGIVESTWQEVAQYSIGQIQTAQMQFNEEQPNIVEFILTFSQDLDQDVAELAIYLTHVIWQMFRRCSKKRMRKIRPRQVIKAYEAREEWLESYKDVDELSIMRRLQSSQEFAQPYVVKYVVEALMEEDEMELSEDDRGYLFLLLLTVIDVLGKAVSGS